MVDHNICAEMCLAYEGVDVDKYPEVTHWHCAVPIGAYTVGSPYQVKRHDIDCDSEIPKGCLFLLEQMMKVGDKAEC